MEFDSLEVISLVNHGCGPYHLNASLVYVITDLLSKEWQVQVSYIYRKQNAIANCFAKAAF